MSKKPVTTKAEAANIVKDIRRATRNVHSAEEKIRIVLAGLRGEDSIADPPNCGIKLSEPPGFTGGQNSRRIARYGTCTKEEDLEAVFTRVP
jgi:hypothetical protein